MSAPRNTATHTAEESPALPARRVAPEIIVYGTVCLDRFQQVDTAGNPLEHPPIELPGGEAFNTATQLAGWGARVLLTGTCPGNDVEGHLLRHLLDTHPLGVSREAIPDRPDAVTPFCQISVYPDGERRMQGRGFDRAKPPLPLPDTTLAGCAIFTADPNLGEAAAVACHQAVRAGCALIAMDMAHLPEIVALSRLVVTSGDAFERFFGSGGRDIVVEELADRLVGQGARTAIITQGAEGGLVVDREEGRWRYQALPVPGIVDTTGAGDAFRAGLCWGLLREMPLRQTVAFARTVAALHCRVPGGASRIPLEEIWKWNTDD